MNRDFIQQKSPWLGVKAHYHFRDFPDNLVALHNFKGGYGGLSKTETGAVNFCYLAEYKTFKEAGNIENFNKNIVRQNPFLNLFLDKAEMIFEKPLGIAQISFQKKQAVENHMSMCGDTAGLIHPLCGNGMAMAIHSAKIAAEHISKYFKDKAYSRTQMEENYGAEWKKTFGRRLKMGRRLQSLLMMPAVSETLITTVTRSPKLLQQLIKSTHGKPILS